MWSRALHGVEWSARHTWARYNKSLDASGVSELVIDNLSVTWLTAAASTQPFGGTHRFKSCLTRSISWKACFGLEVLPVRVRVQSAKSSRVALVSTFTALMKLLNLTRNASIHFVTRL